MLCNYRLVQVLQALGWKRPPIFSTQLPSQAHRPRSSGSDPLVELAFLGREALGARPDRKSKLVLNELLTPRNEILLHEIYRKELDLYLSKYNPQPIHTELK